jgi:hypothetical protein
MDCKRKGFNNDEAGLPANPLSDFLTIESL